MRTARNGTHQGVHHRIHLRTNGQHGIHSQLPSDEAAGSGDQNRGRRHAASRALIRR
jgi:hypothetical protein